jgi:hypothetical protein
MKKSKTRRRFALAPVAAEDAMPESTEPKVPAEEGATETNTDTDTDEAEREEAEAAVKGLVFK